MNVSSVFLYRGLKTLVSRGRFQNTVSMEPGSVYIQDFSNWILSTCLRLYSMAALWPHLLKSVLLLTDLNPFTSWGGLGRAGDIGSWGSLSIPICFKACLPHLSFHWPSPLFLGLPLFLFPNGFHLKACLVVLVFGLHREWPSQPQCIF